MMAVIMEPGQYVIDPADPGTWPAIGAKYLVDFDPVRLPRKVVSRVVDQRPRQPDRPAAVIVRICAWPRIEERVSVEWWNRVIAPAVVDVYRLESGWDRPRYRVAAGEGRRP